MSYFNNQQPQISGDCELQNIDQINNLSNNNNNDKTFDDQQQQSPPQYTYITPPQQQQFPQTEPLPQMMPTHQMVTHTQVAQQQQQQQKVAPPYIYPPSDFKPIPNVYDIMPFVPIRGDPNVSRTSLADIDKYIYPQSRFEQDKDSVGCCNARGAKSKFCSPIVCGTGFWGMLAATIILFTMVIGTENFHAGQPVICLIAMVVFALLYYAQTWWCKLCHRRSYSYNSNNTYGIAEARRNNDWFYQSALNPNLSTLESGINDLINDKPYLSVSVRAYHINDKQTYTTYFKQHHFPILSYRPDMPNSKEFIHAMNEYSHGNLMVNYYTEFLFDKTQATYITDLLDVVYDVHKHRDLRVDVTAYFGTVGSDGKPNYTGFSDYIELYASPNNNSDNRTSNGDTFITFASDNEYKAANESITGGKNEQTNLITKKLQIRSATRHGFTPDIHHGTRRGESWCSRLWTSVPCLLLSLLTCQPVTFPISLCCWACKMTSIRYPARYHIQLPEFGDMMERYRANPEDFDISEVPGALIKDVSSQPQIKESTADPVKM